MLLHHQPSPASPEANEMGAPPPLQRDAKAPAPRSRCDACVSKADAGRCRRQYQLQPVCGHKISAHNRGGLWWWEGRAGWWQWRWWWVGGVWGGGRCGWSKAADNGGMCIPACVAAPMHASSWAASHFTPLHLPSPLAPPLTAVVSCSDWPPWKVRRSPTPLDPAAAVRWAAAAALAR